MNIFYAYIVFLLKLNSISMQWLYSNGENSKENCVDFTLVNYAHIVFLCKGNQNIKIKKNSKGEVQGSNITYIGDIKLRFV